MQWLSMSATTRLPLDSRGGLSDREGRVNFQFDGSVTCAKEHIRDTMVGGGVKKKNKKIGNNAKKMQKKEAKKMGEMKKG